MSIYESGGTAINGGDLTQSEIHLYGSSRLGIYNVAVDVQCLTTTQEITTFIRGNKFFELSNHLGNVLVTVSDKKLQHSTDGTTVDYYNADVISAQDNYVFGMTMPGRNFQSDKYRFGFNGKEKDKDISVGDLDFGARILDARLGRWLSVDPLVSKYTSFSPYNFAINSPLVAIDYDGRDIIIVTSSGNFRMAKTTLLKTTDGKALWNKYGKSKTHDIYIKVGKVESADALANTNYGFTYDQSKFDLSDLVKDDKIHVKDKKAWGVVDEFEGVNISKSKGRKISFIVANEKAFDENDPGSLKLNKSQVNNITEIAYNLAEAIYHEIKSHIDLHGKPDEHKAYGKESSGVFLENYPPAKNTPSERIKDQLRDDYNKGYMDDPRSTKPKTEKNESTSQPTVT